MEKYPTVALIEEGHKYKVTETSGSVHSPKSVTSLLQTGGVIDASWYNDQAREFGVKGHKIVHYYLEGVLGGYDSDFEPWMQGIRKFKKECCPVDYMTEKAVYSKRYDFAGQLDFQGLVTPPGKRTDMYQLDWKFWSKPTKAAISAGEIQLYGYSLASLEMGLANRAPYRALVHFFPFGYKFYFCHDPAAKTVFLSCLNITRWKERVS